MPAQSLIAATTVPLTTMQRLRLLAGCLPFAFFGLVTVLYLTVLRGIYGEPSALMLLFLVVLLVYMGFQALQRLRDLLSGVAVVQEDMLQRSRGSRGRGPTTFWGTFEGLGRLRMMPKAHFQARNGVRHRVTYSPVSRIVWTAEPLS
jgi:hypothetical protein